MKKLTKQDRLRIITSICAEEGKVTKKVIELYIEGNISYGRYKEAIKKGLNYYENKMRMLQKKE
jgi:hypothetical protein